MDVTAAAGHFVVAPPCSFANNPFRRRLERPPVSGDRRIVAVYGRRQTLRAAIGRHQHAICGASVPQRPAAIAIEFHGPGTKSPRRPENSRSAASACHHEHRAVHKSLT